MRTKSPIKVDFLYGSPKFPHVSAMHQIWSQVVGLLVITAWSAGVSSLIFFILKINNKLRLSPEVEISGSDVSKHGEAAYPELAHDTKNQANTVEVDIKH